MPSDALITLAGFMGTGKSTVGRMLAGRMKRPFLDLDNEIESREGRSITDIFSQDGEPSFRRMERALVREMAERVNLVLAVGGGAILDPENVADLSHAGLLVCLDARPEVILARVESQRHRPLLESEDRAERIRSLLRQRAAHYAALPHHVDTSTLSASEVTEEVLRLFHAVFPA